MYYLVKDVASWRSKLAIKKPKIAGFVSGQLTGKEREAFDELFGKFALKFHKKIVFLYVDLDRDQLWDVYDEVNPGMRLIPLVATFDADGNLLKKRINPTEKEFKKLVDLAMLMPVEEIPEVEEEKETLKEAEKVEEEKKAEPEVSQPPEEKVAETVEEEVMTAEKIEKPSEPERPKGEKAAETVEEVISAEEVEKPGKPERLEKPESETKLEENKENKEG